MRFLTVFCLTILLAACSSSYGTLDIPFIKDKPAASAPQETDTVPPQQKGDFTITQAEPLAAIANDVVQIAPIAGTEACELPQGLVGQSKSVLDTMRFKGPIRILGPDSAMTMDFSPSRLNIIYDKNGKITEVKCG